MWQEKINTLKILLSYIISQAQRPCHEENCSMMMELNNDCTKDIYK